jgi:hypothetical protein
MPWLGLGVPLSLLFRLFEKVILDSTGLVQMRHPYHAGGFYYCCNAVMTHVACFVAAALYSAYSTGIARDHERYGAAGGNYTGANATNATVRHPANGTAADYAGKIDDFLLLATIGTLSVVWATSFVCLLLTMKREYVGTFVSLQTGCALSRSGFLDNEGDDESRANIFFCNEWHWRTIRDLVRQWVIGAYATWLQLSPAWLNDALRALIPDDFMPAPVVQQLDAQAPGGRRRTLETMGTRRRISLALCVVEDTAESLAVPPSDLAVEHPAFVPILPPAPAAHAQ